MYWNFEYFFFRFCMFHCAVYGKYLVLKSYHNSGILPQFIWRSHYTRKLKTVQNRFLLENSLVAWLNDKFPPLKKFHQYWLLSARKIIRPPFTTFSLRPISLLSSNFRLDFPKYLFFQEYGQSIVCISCLYHSCYMLHPFNL